jgi:hypothetical protein
MKKINKDSFYDMAFERKYGITKDELKKKINTNQQKT